MKIVVFRACAIGDFVLNLPALQALSLANPTAQFSLVGYPATLTLAKLFIPVEAIYSIDIEPWSRLFHSPLTGLNFDAAFVWSKSPAIADNLRNSGIADVHHAEPFPNNNTHAATHLLESIGLPLPPLPDLWTGHSDRSILHPGAGSPEKRWPYFEQLAQKLSKVSTMLGPQETEDEARLRSLTEVAAELLQCRVFIGNDSGITHLAAYLGCPTVALFGPTNPHFWGPVGRRVQILWKSSLADIPVEEVKAVL